MHSIKEKANHKDCLRKSGGGLVVDQWSCYHAVLGFKPSQCAGTLWKCINPRNQVPVEVRIYHRGLRGSIGCIHTCMHAHAFLAVNLVLSINYKPSQETNGQGYRQMVYIIKRSSFINASMRTNIQ